MTVRRWTNALAAFVGLASAAMAAPASAHHSFAMFDADQTVVLTGAVKELQWTNPHAWLQITVVDEHGLPHEWSIEMSAPSALVRDGWKPKIVRPGDRVTVHIHPLKNGSSGGQFLTIALPDGKLLGQRNLAPAQESPAR